MAAPALTPGRLAMAAVALMLASLMWSGGTVLTRALRADIPPITLSLCRSVVALALLAPFVAGDVRRQWGLVRNDLVRLVAAGITGIALFPIVFFFAVYNTQVLNIALINTTEPLLIALFAWIVLGQRMSGGQGIGFVLGAAGIAVVASQGELDRLLALELHAGDAFMIVCLVQWGIYAVLIQQVSRAISPAVVLAVSFAFGALGNIPFFALEIAVQPVTWTMNGVLLIGYSAVFGALIAFALWNFGSRALGPSRAGFFLYVIPVFTASLSVLFLGETFQRFHLVGAVLIAASVLVSTVPLRRRTSAA